MDARKVLTHLIRAGRDAIHLEKTLTDIGYKETPYFTLYGEITDAIYGILDEHTDTIEESKAYSAVHDIYTPDEICAEELASLIAIPSVSGTTAEIIEEKALERGVSVTTMIQLILSEWAMRQILCKAL